MIPNLAKSEKLFVTSCFGYMAPYYNGTVNVSNDTGNVSNDTGNVSNDTGNVSNDTGNVFDHAVYVTLRVFIFHSIILTDQQFIKLLNYKSSFERSSWLLWGPGHVVKL